MKAVLSRVERMAAKTGHVFIATADTRGVPHMAAAGQLAITRDGHARITEWFCPGTVANLQVNPRVAIVVWDAATDTGYQIIGELESIKDIDVLDGYSPGEEKRPPVPQVERQLLVHVDRVVDFTRAPHTDVVEKGR